MKLVKLMGLYFLFVIVIAVSGCGDSSDDSGPTATETVSFKGLTRAWFSQAPNDSAPTPNDIQFVFDADEDPDAFSDLITIDNEGVEGVEGV